MIEPINQDEDFRNFSWYRRAARRGLVSPLKHGCGTEYISVYGPGDTFALKCYDCDATLIPGQDVLDKIKQGAEALND